MIAHMARGIVLAFLLISIPANTITAQDSEQACPSGLACVVYEYPDGDTDTFTLDPNEGIYQEIIVAFATTEIEYLDGSSVREDPKALVASFFNDGTGYELVRERKVPLEGIYENGEVGDSYGPQELE